MNDSLRLFIGFYWRGRTKAGLSSNAVDRRKIVKISREVN